MSLMPICWYESPTWTRKRFYLFLEMKSDRSLRIMRFISSHAKRSSSIRTYPVINMWNKKA